MSPTIRVSQALSPMPLTAWNQQMATRNQPTATLGRCVLCVVQASAEKEVDGCSRSSAVVCVCRVLLFSHIPWTVQNARESGVTYRPPTTRVLYMTGSVPCGHMHISNINPLYWYSPLLYDTKHEIRENHRKKTQRTAVSSSCGTCCTQQYSGSTLDLTTHHALVGTAVQQQWEQKRVLVPCAVLFEWISPVVSVVRFASAASQHELVLNWSRASFRHTAAVTIVVSTNKLHTYSCKYLPECYPRPTLLPSHC